MHVQSFTPVQFFRAYGLYVTCQAPPSMVFSRQEYWSVLPFPPPGDLPDPGIKPMSPSLQTESVTLLMIYVYTHISLYMYNISFYFSKWFIVFYIDVHVYNININEYTL